MKILIADDEKNIRCIGPSLLSKEIVKGAYANKKDIFLLTNAGINLEQVEESFVKQALELSKGNQTHAAKLLGLSRYALIYRMNKFKLK